MAGITRVIGVLAGNPVAGFRIKASISGYEFP
jgi:hypothetical protein